jgi:hypothetical protein
MSELRPRLFAFLGMLALFALAWLYAREFPIFFNTIGFGKLLAGSVIAAFLLAVGILYHFRERLTPWERHLPEVFFILLLPLIFAPLFGSLLNRSIGKTEFQPFEFVSEVPYFASNYGVLKGEKIQPTGYVLLAKENGRSHKFKYKTQAYYPLTKPGETILLPVRTGLLGFRVVLLK